MIEILEFEIFLGMSKILNLRANMGNLISIFFVDVYEYRMVLPDRYILVFIPNQAT